MLRLAWGLSPFIAAAFVLLAVSGLVERTSWRTRADDLGALAALATCAGVLIIALPHLT